jgi:hypothetical protein
MLQQLRRSVADEFVSRYDVKPLNRNRRILPKVTDQSANECRQVKKKTEEGTFSQKVKSTVEDDSAESLKFEVCSILKMFI